MTVWVAVLVGGLFWVPSGFAQDKGAQDKGGQDKGGQDKGALAGELHTLQTLQKGKTTPLAEVESQGQKLLKEPTSPEEQGRIYFQLAQSYAMKGIFAPERAALVVGYAQQALRFPLPPSERMLMYVYWGDALRAVDDKKPLADARRVAAEIYLTGLKELERENLPENPPEVPPLGRRPFKGGPEQLREYEKAVKAREKALRDEELYTHRKVLMGQLVQTYARKPCAATELRDLSMKVVGNPALTDRLMKALEERGALRDDPDDRPVTLEASPSGNLRLLVGIASVAGLAMLLGFGAWRARRRATPGVNGP
jgi:hypothetical protein